MTVLLVLLVVFVIAALAIFPKLKGGKGAERLPYRAKAILTDNEREFYGRLRQAFPDHEVFPQVSMSAFVEVERGLEKKERGSAWGRISQKTVDFVVCEKGTLEIVVVIELDDKTHAGKEDKDAFRDSIVEAAGLPTFRWKSKAKPTPDEIAKAVLRSGATEGDPA